MKFLLPLNFVFSKFSLVGIFLPLHFAIAVFVKELFFQIKTTVRENSLK